MEIRKISRRPPRCEDEEELVVLQRTAKKCTKIYNTRAQPLFCSLNLLLVDVLVAVVVVVCLSSLVSWQSVDETVIGPSKYMYRCLVTIFLTNNLQTNVTEIRAFNM